MATAIIVAEKVFGPRTVNTKNGPGEVFDVVYGETKYGAWGNLGQTIKRLEGQALKIEYTEFEKDGYVNRTIKSADPVALNGQTLSESKPGLFRTTAQPLSAKDHQINRSVAAYIAKDLLIAAGDVSTGLDVVFALNELTDALVPVVDGTFSEIGELSSLELGPAE